MGKNQKNTKSGGKNYGGGKNDNFKRRRDAGYYDNSGGDRDNRNLGNGGGSYDSRPRQQKPKTFPTKPTEQEFNVELPAIGGQRILKNTTQYKIGCKDAHGNNTIYVFGAIERVDERNKQLVLNYQFYPGERFDAILDQTMRIDLADIVSIQECSVIYQVYKASDSTGSINPTDLVGDDKGWNFVFETEKRTYNIPVLSGELVSLRVKNRNPKVDRNTISMYGQITAITTNADGEETILFKKFAKFNGIFNIINDYKVKRDDVAGVFKYSLAVKLGDVVVGKE